MSSSALSVFLTSPGVSQVVLNAPPSSAVVNNLNATAFGNAMSSLLNISQVNPLAANQAVNAEVVLEWIIGYLRQAGNLAVNFRDVISGLELQEHLIDPRKMEEVKRMLHNYFASAMDHGVLVFQSCMEQLGQIQFQEFIMKNSKNIARFVDNRLQDASTILESREITPLTAAAVVALGVIGGYQISKGFLRLLRRGPRRARDVQPDEDLQNGEGRPGKRARIGEDEDSHPDQDVQVPTAKLVIDKEPRESDATNGTTPSVMPEATGMLHHEHEDMTERASVTTPDNERSPGFNAVEAPQVVDQEDEEDQSNTEDEDGSDKDLIANVAEESDEEDDASSDDSVDEASSDDSNDDASADDPEVEEIAPSRIPVPKQATTKPTKAKEVIDLTGSDEED